MFAKKPQTEIVTRLILSVVIFLNAMIPTAALAKSIQELDAGSASEVGPQSPRTLPEQEPQYFNPPSISIPQQTSPNPDEPPSPIPARDDIEFNIIAEPVIAPVGGVVVFIVYLRNNSKSALNGLIFTDQLETGLDFVPDLSSPVTFDEKSREITFEIKSLEIGEETKFTYSVMLMPSKLDATEGKIWLHSAELATSDDSLRLQSSAAIGVGLAVADAESKIAILPADGGWNDLGRVQLYMEKDSLGPNALVVFSPTRLPDKGPEYQFKLDVYETSPVTMDTLGQFDEQAITLIRENLNSFAKPAFLEINLDEYVDLQNIPAGQEIYVATYDEANDIWVKVPILEQSTEDNSVTIAAAHFSI